MRTANQAHMVEIPLGIITSGDPHRDDETRKDNLEASSSPNNGGSAVKEPPAQESAAQDGAPEVDTYLHGLPLFLMVVCLMVGIFTIALDNSIISTAIPKISNEFDSLDDVAWYGSVYFLSQMSFQPTFGKMYTFFNLKWVYLSAGAIFEAGSILCAAAPNSPAFIIGRSIAGLGAAGLMCGGILILSQIAEMRKRPMLLGIVSSMYGVASVVGPSIGGAFTNSARLTWRFCFWINLPLGAIAGLIMCAYYPASSGAAPKRDRAIREKLGGIGFKSALILNGTLVCLILALQWGGAVYKWSDSRVWGCFLGFGLLLILFGLMQFRQKEDALIPLRILSQRSVLLGCIFSIMLQGGMTTQSYHLPFFFQAVKGVDPQESGVDILPHGVTVSIATIISGTLITLSGHYVPFMWLGSSVFVTGGGLLFTLSRSSSIAKWFGYEVVAGFGFGLTVQIPVFATQVVLNAADLPIGTTLVIMSQALGGSVGLSVAQNVFQNTLRHSLREIEGVNLNAVIAAGGIELEKVVPAEVLGLVRDAFKRAVASAFLVSVGLGGVAFLASLGMQIRKIQSKGKSGGEN